MKRPFAASVWRQGNWYVSQCLELDVATQGETEEEALTNLTEALELHLQPPQATRAPNLRTIEVEVGRLNPQPFREIKRRLEAAGFTEASQKGSYVKFVNGQQKTDSRDPFAWIDQILLLKVVWVQKNPTRCYAIKLLGSIRPSY